MLEQIAPAQPGMPAEGHKTRKLRAFVPVTLPSIRPVLISAAAVVSTALLIVAVRLLHAIISGAVSKRRQTLRDWSA